MRPNWMLALWMAATTVGCHTQYIPNTDVEDTDENRRIVQFCEEYRKAVEARNIAILLKLAHPTYYEDGGNLDAADDLDFAGLREYLEEEFRKNHSAEPFEAHRLAKERSWRILRSKEVFDISKESKTTLDLYGESEFAKGCLVARRLIEEGVRVVQLSHSIRHFLNLTTF